MPLFYSSSFNTYFSFDSSFWAPVYVIHFCKLVVIRRSAFITSVEREKAFFDARQMVSR